MKGHGEPQLHRKQARRRWGPKMLAWVLVTALLAPSLCTPFTFAAEPPEGKLCPHHPEHTVDCGYIPAREASPCTHKHDANCGGLTVPAEPEETKPETPTEPAQPEESEPEAPALPAESGDTESDVSVETNDSGMDAKPEGPEESTGCNHVHDEFCGYAEAQEGRPCNFVCDKCVLAWEWANEDEDWENPLVPIGGTGIWGLDLPGVSEANPITREVLELMLPQAITAQTAAGERDVKLVWDFGSCPESAASGSYTLSASLEGDYLLTQTAPKLEVRLDLGGGNMYQETADKMKFLNKWYFISRDESEMTGNTITVAIQDLNSKSPEEIKKWLIDTVLPQRLGGWVPNDTSNDPRLPTLGFIQNTKNLYSQADKTVVK